MVRQKKAFVKPPVGPKKCPRPLLQTKKAADPPITPLIIWPPFSTAAVGFPGKRGLVKFPLKEDVCLQTRVVGNRLRKSRPPTTKGKLREPKAKQGLFETGGAKCPQKAGQNGEEEKKR